MTNPADLDPFALRDAYDAELRARVCELGQQVRVDRDGPLVRVTEAGQRGFVTYRSLGMDGPELDALIVRQRDFYAARGSGAEWKLHGHDAPADLPSRLRAAGFRPEEQETVMIGLAAPLADAAPRVQSGVRLRQVSTGADLDRIAAMEEEVWGEDRSFLAPGLAGELAADPSQLTVVVAEAGFDGSDPGTVVGAGWVRCVPGTRFATLWGGSTLPRWRRRGIYTALLANRAWLAAGRGHTLLEVDASAESQPILRRRGFVAVTTTTPYVYSPDAHQ